MKFFEEKKILFLAIPILDSDKCQSDYGATTAANTFLVKYFPLIEMH